MRASRRILIAAGVLVMLAAAAAVAYWYQFNHAAPGPTTEGLTVKVTAAADRGPGSLREALFIAAAASTRATVLIQVPRITLASPLPPLINPNGMSVVARGEGVVIEGEGLGGGSVFDVTGDNTSIEGITIRDCPAAGILLRAKRFRLAGAAIEGCDVAIDVAENAGDILIERNRFSKNRVGVRFAASIREATVAKNAFADHGDAAIWAVRSAADSREPSIAVRGNRFDREPLGVLAGNVALLVESNEFRDAKSAAVQLIGAGAVIRGNRISGGASMGIVAENARAAIVDDNEIDHLKAYGIMVKNSSNMLIRGNRVHNCGYGMAFVLGDAVNPSTAVENTIIESYYNGIDVIGDSPILRRNHVLRPRVRPLNVSDFVGPDGRRVKAKPFLDNNTFGPGAATIADSSAAAEPASPR